MKTKKRKGAGRPPTPAQWKIPYEISGEPLDGLVTGHGGVAVTSRAFRGMKLPGACNANLGALRKINRGRTPGEVVESAVVAVLQGADCVGEIDIIREDPAVERMLGYSPASSPGPGAVCPDAPGGGKTRPLFVAGESSRAPLATRRAQIHPGPLEIAPDPLSHPLPLPPNKISRSFRRSPSG